MPTFTCLNTAMRSTVSTGHAISRLWLGPHPPNHLISHCAALTRFNLSIKPHLMLSRVSLLTYLLLTHPVPSLRRSPFWTDNPQQCCVGLAEAGEGGIQNTCPPAYIKSTPPKNPTIFCGIKVTNVFRKPLHCSLFDQLVACNYGVE